MAHPLRNILSIDVDNDPHTGWPGGIQKLLSVRVEARPIMCALFDPRSPSCAADMKEWRSDQKVPGRIAGLRMDPRWLGSSAGVCALKFSNWIETFQPTVAEYDVELKDVGFETELLLGTRIEDDSASWTKGLRGRGGFFPDPAHPDTLGYRWGRPFVYTFEGRQSPGTSAAATAAQAGGLIGPQPYNGAMTEWWDPWWELKTWVRGAKVPLEKMLLYYDADKEHRPGGVSECVLFATSRLTELYV